MDLCDSMAGANGGGADVGGDAGRQAHQGMGKGGSFWLSGHRSLAFAAAALAHDSCESDDSIDIVLR